MKKLLLIVSCGVLVTLATSCAKECVCTRYEDGKKILLHSDSETKYYDKLACESNSVTPRAGESYIVDGKDVTVEIRCKLR